MQVRLAIEYDNNDAIPSRRILEPIFDQPVSVAFEHGRYHIAHAPTGTTIVLDVENN